MFRECSVSVKMPVVHPVGDSETRKLLSKLAFESLMVGKRLQRLKTRVRQIKTFAIIRKK